jgi:hypothetical protein
MDGGLAKGTVLPARLLPTVVPPCMRPSWTPARTSSHESVVESALYTGGRSEGAWKFLKGWNSTSLETSAPRWSASRDRRE